MEAEKRECLSETSQHQFWIISIANKPTKKLADNRLSYLHRYTCDMARHFCVCQHYKPQIWPWLSSPSTENSCCVWLPTSQKQHASRTSIWNYLLLLKLRQKPQATSPLTQVGCTEVAQTRRLHPSPPTTLWSISSGKLLPAKMMPVISPALFPTPAEN